MATSHNNGNFSKSNPITLIRKLPATYEGYYMAPPLSLTNLNPSLKPKALTNASIVYSLKLRLYIINRIDNIDTSIMSMKNLYNNKAYCICCKCFLLKSIKIACKTLHACHFVSKGNVSWNPCLRIIIIRHCNVF